MFIVVIVGRNCSYWTFKILFVFFVLQVGSLAKSMEREKERERERKRERERDRMAQAGVEDIKN